MDTSKDIREKIKDVHCWQCGIEYPESECSGISEEEITYILQVFKEYIETKRRKGIIRKFILRRRHWI